MPRNYTSYLNCPEWTNAYCFANVLRNINKLNLSIIPGLCCHICLAERLSWASRCSPGVALASGDVPGAWELVTPGSQGSWSQEHRKPVCPSWLQISPGLQGSSTQGKSHTQPGRMSTVSVTSGSPITLWSSSTSRRQPWNTALAAFTPCL